MSLGDRISFYIDQMNLLNIIVRKDGDLRMALIQLEHLFGERERMELLLKAVAADRDQFKQELDKLKADVLAKDGQIKRLKHDVDEKDLKIAGLEGRLQGKELAAEWKPVVTDITGLIKSYIEKGNKRAEEGQNDNQGSQA